MINAAFIYVAPDQNPQEQKAVIRPETLTYMFVDALTYEQDRSSSRRNWLQTDVVPLSCVQGLVTKELHGSRRQLGRRFR